MRTNRLAIENAVLRQAAPLNPFKTRQVVLALEDPEYAELLEYDDRDELNPVSVARALQRLAKAEPYLFKTPEAAESLDDGRFKGKSPGGGAGGSSLAKSKEDAILAEMLAAVGINKKSENGGM